LNQHKKQNSDHSIVNHFQGKNAPHCIDKGDFPGKEKLKQREKNIVEHCRYGCKNKVIHCGILGQTIMCQSYKISNEE
jgi:DNA-binding NarL/FixJ family response regulator